ncbi:MAG: segregation/condensation protein A [Lachnospiraceae bacterium]|nr:segregation/condensation protein A [Lachnospiraceae bacterium]MDD3795747.1 segregation/condensation protein A [Lachnospiraceae bacterium]
MGIPVKLQAFEGPLDLLLHLIDKNKINIYDIPIIEITNQYLAYIALMKDQNLDVMSEFLVMAATLIDIKSKMLLPAEVNEEGEEEDPRAELVEKLLEYKMYKYMSYELRDQEEEAAGSMYRKADVPNEVKAYREPVDLDELLKDVTLSRMHAIYKDILKRQENRLDPIRSTFGKIEKDEVDLGETMNFVEQYIMDRGACTFRSLLMLRKGKMYVVVTFLTILELMKMGKVGIEQESTFAEIYITAKDKSEWNEVDAEEEFAEDFEEIKGGQ